MNINLNLIFKDRVGIVADIATVIAGKGLNISFMEVVLEEGKAIIYLEVENPKDGVSQEEIFKMTKELESFKKLSKDYLSLSFSELERAIKMGVLTELEQ